MNFDNVIQNFYRNSGNLRLPTSNQPNIDALSTKYNRGIYSVKKSQKLPISQSVKELFIYFKYLTVLRALQIDPNVITQSTDPFVNECIQITQNANTPYRPRYIINKITRSQQQRAAMERTRTPTSSSYVDPVGGKRKRKRL